MILLWFRLIKPTVASIKKLILSNKKAVWFSNESISRKIWRASSCSPAHHNDIYRYNRGTSTWTRIATNGNVPLPRVRMGFTATPNGTIYLFGGYSDYNGELERWIGESLSKIRVIVSNKWAKPNLNSTMNSDGHVFNLSDLLLDAG